MREEWAVELARLLFKYGISKVQLAKKMGCSVTYVYDVMRGYKKSSDATREKFRTALDELIAERNEK